MNLEVSPPFNPMNKILNRHSLGTGRFSGPGVLLWLCVAIFSSYLPKNMYIFSGNIFLNGFFDFPKFSRIPSNYSLLHRCIFYIASYVVGVT